MILLTNRKIIAMNNTYLKVQKKLFFWLLVPMVEPLLHHKYPLPYTDKLRGLYSPPFRPVYREFSSFPYYCDILGFLYTWEVSLFRGSPPYFTPHKLCLSRSFFREWEVGSRRQMKPILTWNQNESYITWRVC